MERKNFLQRVQTTEVGDMWGKGRNLKKSVLEMLRNLPEDQHDENFRELLRTILETESGSAGEETWVKSTYI